ncbi:MAG: hypothetical protein EZS28_012213 [Streblomastix strix]|uniref:Uncharacterized protein n=1 Tax=Streblomastix strix TaxID=222440 RepID=A0A5J4WBC9_9EUKA|nr:MAG: hypothetical protein EZS28_012213 [Streblomastix strix]
MISADGNSPSFNGTVITGTGATNGATNGSVNYSAGNPILWELIVLEQKVVSIAMELMFSRESIHQQ